MAVGLHLCPLRGELRLPGAHSPGVGVGVGGLPAITPHACVSLQPGRAFSPLMPLSQLCVSRVPAPTSRVSCHAMISIMTTVAPKEAQTRAQG